MSVTDVDKKRVIRHLRALENNWPGGLMLFANASGGNIVLCEGHPQGGGKQIAAFNIKADGGDPDWAEDSDEVEPPKRLRKFAPSKRFKFTEVRHGIKRGPIT